LLLTSRCLPAACRLTLRFGSLLLAAGKLPAAVGYPPAQLAIANCQLFAVNCGREELGFQFGG